MDNERPVREDLFGQRYLNNEDDVWNFNAWDNVEFTKERLEEINEILERQRDSAIDDERKKQLITNADRSWDSFYGRNANRFFKDRKWMVREFPEVFRESDSKSKTFALEVGCGAGNTTFPLLETTAESNPNLFVYCCDFSPTAVQLIRDGEKFDSDRCLPFVWDITQSDADIPIKPNSLDYILCVFVLSALPPEKHQIAVNNLVSLLKKGGILYAKDYQRHDLAQLRFKKNKYISENFYARGDGTFAYFFDNIELHNLLTKAGLEKIENFVDKRMIVNRAEKKMMHRRWNQLKYNKKQLLRLTCEVSKYRAYLEQLSNNQNVKRHLIKSKELVDHPILCLILLYEIIFGAGIRVKDREVQQILKAAKKDILFEHEQLKCDFIPSTSIELPRYVRINRLCISVNDALLQLKDAGFNLVDNVEIVNQEKFNEMVQNLQSRDFCLDIHIPDLLVFHPKIDLHNLDLVKNKYLILQDKASCLPAFILQPDQNSEVIDACAAPGMKTTHLASLMNNNGKIWAFDRDKNRCKTLSSMLKDSNVKNAEVLNSDFLKEDTTADKYSKVEYCLTDVPCSGSGMVKRGNDSQEEVDLERIAKLSNLQSMILKHALKMPNLKRLVYSTCSIHEEENEKVVKEALSEFKGRFELVDPLPEWKRTVIGDYSFGSKCLRADPSVNLTNGFFVALFQAK